MAKIDQRLVDLLKKYGEDNSAVWAHEKGIEAAVCPICNEAFKLGDVLRPRRNAPGPCHDECLASVRDFDLETGEPIIDNLPTFLYEKEGGN